MAQFITSNGLLMLKCNPLNWRIEKKYAIGIPGEKNPEFYNINVGSLSDMWSCTLIPETMILSFSSMHYSKDDVYRFKVDSIEEASELVLKFAKGMNKENDLTNTIYTL